MSLHFITSSLLVIAKCESTKQFLTGLYQEESSSEMKQFVVLQMASCNHFLGNCFLFWILILKTHKYQPNILYDVVVLT